ncbi:MAG: TonB C-terminal domain-containing protein [Akkermansiaceae bacterium]|nr:TonB C-terminal domain-containing protein [Verrucomicrobiales bacterium]
MAHRKREKRTSRISVVISLLFHAVLIAGLFFLAAREGMLGKELKKIAVTMVPKEKPTEKPKEKLPEPKPEVEEPKAEPPKVAAVQPEIARSTPPPGPATGIAAPPSIAPPANAIAAFDFEGGKAVETSSDPDVLYKGYLEYTLRSRWNRPVDLDDANYVAEAEVAVDASGRLLNSVWKRGSGNSAWDNSVKKVLSETGNIGRPPPNGFPKKVLVRFDVLVATEVGIE